MAVRLEIVAHPRMTGSESDPVFGDASPLRAPEDVRPLPGRVLGWACGPEPACVRTAELLGGNPITRPDLAGPAFGCWTGRPLSDVATADPAGLSTWMADPDAAPHGGESLAAATIRLGRTCDHTDWPEGRSVVVVTPLAAKLIAVHALDAGAELVFRLDVPPGGRFELSGGRGRWRLILR